MDGKKIKRFCITSLLLLLLWLQLAISIQNEIILPTPFQVVTYMWQQLQDINTYIALIQTLSLVAIAVTFSFLLSFFLILFSFRYPTILDYVAPIISICRSIPTISLSLFIVFWFSSIWVSIGVCFLVLFPSIFEILHQVAQKFPTTIKDVMKVYENTFLKECKYIYIPYMKQSCKNAICFGFGFGCKVAIMAEIIGQVNFGVGRQINICRQNLNMSGVFAWTIWILLVGSIIQVILHYIKKTT